MDGASSREAQLSIAASSVFPGFWFCPTDEELISYYLTKKLDGHEDSIQVIPEIELCNFEPWDLPGLTTFEMEYGHWVEEQNRQISELKSALNANIGDIELRILVDGIMNCNSEIFCMKSAAAKADVFYIMSGMWKTTAERFFLWIGGFRPSELLKVMIHI